MALPINFERGRVRLGVLIAAVAAVGAIGVLFAAVVWSSNERGVGIVEVERPSGGDATVGSLTETIDGDRWSVRSVSDLAGRTVLYLIWDQSGTTTVHGIDAATGERVAELTVRSPGALVTRTDERLVISAAGPSPDGAAHSFLVFSVGDRIALEAEVPVDLAPAQLIWAGPRINESGQAIVADDGEHLYYLPEGGSGSTQMGVVDLETHSARVITGLAACDSPYLHPAGGQSVFVVCPKSGEIEVRSPNGTMAGSHSVGGLAGGYDDTLPSPLGEGQPLRVMMTFDDWPGAGVVYHDGTYAISHLEGTTVGGSVLPEDRPMIVGWQGDVVELDEDRVVIPYLDVAPTPGAETADPSLNGFVIFNRSDHSIEHDVRIQHYGTYPIAPDRIVIVGEHRIDILDTAEMSITQAFEISHPDADVRPETADWKPGVR